MFIFLIIIYFYKFKWSNRLNSFTATRRKESRFSKFPLSPPPKTITWTTGRKWFGREVSKSQRRTKLSRLLSFKKMAKCSRKQKFHQITERPSSRPKTVREGMLSGWKGPMVGIIGSESPLETGTMLSISEWCSKTTQIDRSCKCCLRKELGPECVEEGVWGGNGLFTEEGRKDKGERWGE